MNYNFSIVDYQKSEDENKAIQKLAEHRDIKLMVKEIGAVSYTHLAQICALSNHTSYCISGIKSRQFIPPPEEDGGILAVLR